MANITNRKWYQNWYVRLIFPPFLIWDIAKYITTLIWNITKFITNFLFGKLVGLLVLPAQISLKRNLASICDYFSRYKAWGEENQRRISEYSVTTSDGVNLQTIKIDKIFVEQHIQNKKYVICFSPNAACYQTIVPEIAEYFFSKPESSNFTILGFNYRGINYPSNAYSIGGGTPMPRSIDDLIKDGIAQVQYLINQGVPPNDIILYGHSLGGTIIPFVGEYFHDKNLKIKIFSDRTLSSVTNFVMGQLRSNGENKEIIFRKILSYIAWPVVKLFLLLTKWEKNAAEAYNKIDNQYKHCIAIRAKERHFDGVIRPYASLYQALSIESKKTAHKVTLNPARLLNDGFNNNRAHGESITNLIPYYKNHINNLKCSDQNHNAKQNAGEILTDFILTPERPNI